jgi:hypothetical protein
MGATLLATSTVRWTSVTAAMGETARTEADVTLLHRSIDPRPCGGYRTQARALQGRPGEMGTHCTLRNCREGQRVPARPEDS